MICCWIGSLTSQTRIFQLYIWGLVQADWNYIVLLLNLLLHVTINDISVIHLVFPISPKNTKLDSWRWDLASCQFRWIPFSGFRGEVENVSTNQRSGRPTCSSDWPKNTNLVEDVEILLPDNFRWIPFSGFRGEVENVSGNQRPGRPFLFFRSARKTQTLYRTLRSYFLSSFI